MDEQPWQEPWNSQEVKYIYIYTHLFVYLKVRIFKCSYHNPTVGNREDAMTKLVTVILGADGALETGVKQPAHWI